MPLHCKSCEAFYVVISHFHINSLPVDNTIMQTFGHRVCHEDTQKLSVTHNHGAFTAPLWAPSALTSVWLLFLGQAVLKASATRGPWPPLASARWVVRRRRDWSIVVASWASGVKVAWRSRGGHAAASRVWRRPSESRVTWRRGGTGSVPVHGWKRASEVHGRGGRRRAHAHWSTPTSMTSHVWVRTHPPHSSHGCKSVHGSFSPSTSPVSRWTKPFYHAPPTTHAASTHPTPASKPTTPKCVVH